MSDLKARTADAAKKRTTQTTTTTLPDELQKAKTLIQQKRYDDARALLRTIKHPTAIEWLTRLEQRTLQPAAIHAPPSRLHQWRWLIVTGLIILVLAGVYLVYDATVLSTARNEGRVTARLFAYCLDATHAAGVDSGVCSGWYEQAFTPSKETVLACDRLSPELDTAFNQCLIDENILPPGVVKTR